MDVIARSGRFFWLGLVVVKPDPVPRHKSEFRSFELGSEPISVTPRLPRGPFLRLVHGPGISRGSRMCWNRFSSSLENNAWERPYLWVILKDGDSTVAQKLSRDIPAWILG